MKQFERERWQRAGAVFGSRVPQDVPIAFDPDDIPLTDDPQPEESDE